jgi:hypothetical protein
MTLEGPPRSIRFAVRINVQYDPRDLAPVGTFRIRIEHAHVGDGMLFIVDGERGIGGRVNLLDLRPPQGLRFGIFGFRGDFA